MSSDAGVRLSAKQALALHTLYDYTRPGGVWMQGGRYTARSNSLASLERRGLAAVRQYVFRGETVDEWQITREGQAWIEEQPDGA